MLAAPDSTVYPLDHLAVRWSLSAGESPALVLKDRVLSHEALNARVGLLAGWLKSQVPNAGARIATWLPKTELACLMPLAAVRAGLVHVPINPLLKRAQVVHILADSGASLLIANKARLDAFEPGDALCRAFAEPRVWAETEQLDTALPPSNACPDSLAAILYTSGSTGRPKGVMLSQTNLWLGAVSVAHYLQMQPSDRVLAVLPLAFDYGQNQLLSSWYAGGAVVPLDYLTPRDVMKAVDRHSITTIAAVPPLWLQLAELEWPAQIAGHLKRLTNSGGALTPALVRALRHKFPKADIYPMYGLTEAFRSTYLDPSLVDEHPTSIGKAIPFAEILVINDAGQAAGPDEEGELVHTGPLVAQGYWQDATRTAERFKLAPPFSENGGMAVWSGDRVRFDKQGLLHFVGRRDAMIKTNGNRVSPQEVEEAAIATGLVAEAVALGLPDPQLGAAIHLVVRALGDTAAARDGLIPALTRALPNFMVPRHVHWREAMPTNPNGKLDRVALSAELGAATERRIGEATP